MVTSSSSNISFAFSSLNAITYPPLQTSMFPFDDGEILDLNPRSDIEGINIDTGSIISIDKLNRNKKNNVKKSFYLQSKTFP